MRDWTGAEIRQCCDMADALNLSVAEAAQFIVPVAISAREQMNTLRKQASGRYLSASNTGVYYHDAAIATKKTRKVNLD